MTVEYAIESEAPSMPLTNEELTRRLAILTQIVSVLEERLANIDNHELVYVGTTEGRKIGSCKLP